MPRLRAHIYIGRKNTDPVAAMILVAGIATQSALAMVAGSIGVAVLAGALVALVRVSAKPIGR